MTKKFKYAGVILLILFGVWIPQLSHTRNIVQSERAICERLNVVRDSLYTVYGLVSEFSDQPELRQVFRIQRKKLRTSVDRYQETRSGVVSDCVKTSPAPFPLNLLE